EEKYYNIIREAFLTDTAKKYFNTDAILKLLEDHKLGKHDYSRHIWNIYMFLVWHDQFFARTKATRKQ
nr:hypothetical protein [Lachnospiraceae bacterium]